MKLNKVLIKLICLLCYSSQASYYQQSTICLYFENSASRNDMHTILNKFNIKYKDVTEVHASDEELYIISGKNETLSKLNLPLNYIVYQTNNLEKRMSQDIVKLFSKAVAVWDVNLENINRYKNKIQNYNYLPKANYEFLDPVILPCFLPIDALSSYKQVLVYSKADSDISMHLPSLFCHTIFQKAELIVEAGVRWGNGSTVPLSAAKNYLDSFMVGIDIVDCSSIYAHLTKCTFLNINDLDFPFYLKSGSFPKNNVDFVFIDTTHSFDHTIKEIEMFVSILAENGTLAFHDSNPVPGDPDGVKIALKKYFNINFDESKFGNYKVERDNYIWNIIHYPYCNGMTLAKRIKKLV